MRHVDAFTKANRRAGERDERVLRRHPAQGSVAANTGQGPGHGLGPLLLPGSLPVEMHGGRRRRRLPRQEVRRLAPRAEAYGKVKGKWIAIPMAFNGGYINYRISAVNKAGFQKVPEDHAGFLELCKAMKKTTRRPASRWATPPATPIRGSTGPCGRTTPYLVDANEKIVHQLAGDRQGARIRQGALRDLRARHGVVERFVQQQGVPVGRPLLYLTGNGISVYAAAKNEKKDIAADMDHAVWPVGKSGKPTEFQLAFRSRLHLHQGAECL